MTTARPSGVRRVRVPGLRVRRNYPYRGAADGLTTHLRRQLGPRYLGVELEINQALLLGAQAPMVRLTRALLETLREQLVSGDES